MPSPLNVLLIGYGAMGSTLARAVESDPGIRISQVLARSGSHEKIRARLDGSVALIASAAEVAKNVTCAVECAGHAAVREHVPALLRLGVDVMLASVGSLSEPGLPELLEGAAKEGGAQLTLIPGAVAGIDALAAARPHGLDWVEYVGRKPPLGWRDTAAETLTRLEQLTSEFVI